MKKILLILLVLFVLVSVCSCQNNSHDTGRSGNDSNIDSETADPKDTGEYYHTDAETYSIETPYGPLYYPAMWKDITKLDMMEDETSFRVSFNAVLDTHTLPLYTIVFGESETGYLICELPTDNGSVAVYCEDQTAGQTELLSQASKETYLLMSEDINVIISNLMDAVSNN